MRLLILLAWLAAVAAIFFLVTQPVDLDTHFLASVIVIIIIAILKLFDRTGAMRAIVLGLGTAVVLRYVYWRTFTTIPPIGEFTNFVPGFILYLAEMYSVVMLFLSLFVVADPLNRPRVALRSDEDEPLPTVDIFIPSLNEEPQLLATTLSAAKQLEYPDDRFNVYLLDDGGTDAKLEDPDPQKASAAAERRRELQALCGELGVNYLTREANRHAKAGNLNHGLAQTSGEFVVVLDADHAPARDFLKETLGYFQEDEKLFLVQTPHFFINPDPLEHNLETWNRMPSENEMFYGVIQKGLDKWNATFFCGSAAVLRRTALEEGGGFSGSSITEDCETSLDLHALGWNSAYVERPMIAGLQPETFANFIGQRSRWCQGMMQILILRNPLFRRGLSLPQRICYVSSMAYWLFPLARLTFLFAPLFYLFFGQAIFDASGAEFASYTITYILVNLLMQNYLWNRVRWPFVSELYETIQSVYLIRALGAVGINPRKPTFKVTAKGVTNQRSRISELGGPFYIIFFILVAGVVATVWRLIAQPFAADVALVVGGWNLFNLLLMGAALGVVAERRQLRTSSRVAIERPAEVIYGDRVIPAHIDDVSISGARIRVPTEALRQVSPGEPIAMRFETLAPLYDNELPLVVRTVTREEGGVLLGAEFAVADPCQYAQLADLVFANSEEWCRFQGTRRTDMGILRGLFEFFSLAAFQTVRGLTYLVTTSQPRRARAEAGTQAANGMKPPGYNAARAPAETNGSVGAPTNGALGSNPAPSGGGVVAAGFSRLAGQRAGR